MWLVLRFDLASSEVGFLQPINVNYPAKLRPSAAGAARQPYSAWKWRLSPESPTQPPCSNFSTPALLLGRQSARLDALRPNGSLVATSPLPPVRALLQANIPILCNPQPYGTATPAFLCRVKSIKGRQRPPFGEAAEWRSLRRHFKQYCTSLFVVLSFESYVLPVPFVLHATDLT